MSSRLIKRFHQKLFGDHSSAGRLSWWSVTTTLFSPPVLGGEDQTLPPAEGEAGVHSADGPGVHVVLRHRGAE